MKKTPRNGFTFEEMVKLKKNIDSNLSYKNICLYLKLPIPKTHNECSRKISQKQNQNM